MFVVVGGKKFLLKKYSYNALNLFDGSETNNPFPINIPLNDIFNVASALPSTIAYAVYGIYIPNNYI